MNTTCWRPIAVSPASYIPGASLARGSLASEPVMPAGSGGAGTRANGFSGVGFVSAGFADSGDGDGEGEGVCPWRLDAKPKQTKSEATSKRKVMMCTRFIVSPLQFFLPALFA